MSFKLAEAYVEIGARDNAFNAALGKARKALGSFATMRVAMPGAMSEMLALLGGTALFKAAIGGASDLAETMNKVDTVFGDQAKTIVAESDKLAASFGTNKREYLDAASSFAMLAKGMGLAGKDAVDLAKKMTKLGMDAKSQMNLASNPEAWDRMRAALKGEYDSIDNLNVIMNESTVTARALAMTHKSSAGELTNLEKFTARAALITEGLSSASGDLDRTAGGAANQMAKFWGSLENLATSIGNTALPAFTQLVTLMNEVSTSARASADAGTGALAGFFAYVESGVATVGLIWRNLGDIFALTGVSIAEGATHSAERLMWFAGVVGGVVKATVIDAFMGIYNSAKNLATNIGQLVTEIYNYLASGFKDPVELHFTPILEGFESKLKKFEMPPPELSDFSGQRDAILERMNATEKDRGDKTFAAEQARKAATAAAAQATAPDAAKKKDDKAEITDAAGFTRKLLEASLEGTGDKQVEAIDKVGMILHDVRKILKDPPKPVVRFG